MTKKEEKRQLLHRFLWVLIAALGIAFFVWLSWAGGRYDQSQCGEDKGSIYSPAVCEQNPPAQTN